MAIVAGHLQRGRDHGADSSATCSTCASRRARPPVLYLLLVPIEFITQIIVRPITLSVRLWANFLAGHFLLAVFFLGTIAMLEGFLAIFAPFSFAIGIALVGFEIFVSGLQAFIFSILTASYIGRALAEGALDKEAACWDCSLRRRQGVGTVWRRSARVS